MPSTESSPLGIYLSIPFCRAKCSYCNFASGVFGGERMDTYVDRLCQEIRQTPQRVQKTTGVHQVSRLRPGAGLTDSRNLPSRPPACVDTIYFGGGTPSLLSIQRMHEILQALHDVFSVAPNAEITVECAPGQLSDALREALPALGTNRVSLGVQSFVDREAAAVGRSHTRAVVLEEIARLRDAGIRDINLDLIAGLPHQTAGSWRESLAVAVSTGVPHLSVYMLDVDEDSRLGREMLGAGSRYGAANVPDEQAIAAMYSEACEQFAAAGIPQYEISNFARPGRESRHNLKYWTREPYLGFGLDAHSFLPTCDGNAVRVATTDDLTEYLTGNAPQAITSVSESQAIEEAWFLGLRLNRGVSLSNMEREFGPPAVNSFHPVLEECEQEELLERDGDRVRLTPRGRLFANEVFTRFLGVPPTEIPAAMEA